MHKISGLVMICIVALSYIPGAYGMDDEDTKSSSRQSPQDSSSSNSGYEDDKTPLHNTNETEEEKDIAPFLTVRTDKKTIFISGLKIVNNKQNYQFMIKKMAAKVFDHILNGQQESHKKNQYKQLSFLSSTFNEDLLTDIGKELSIYKHLSLKTHFYQCYFEQPDLHKCLQHAGDFAKKSTFELCKDGQ